MIQHILSHNPVCVCVRARASQRERGRETQRETHRERYKVRDTNKDRDTQREREIQSEGVCLSNRGLELAGIKQA